MQRATVRRWRPTLPAGGRLVRSLWDVLWLPFWFGSTLEPPALPGRYRDQPPPVPDHVPIILVQLDAIRRVVWRRRVAVFACRLGSLLCMVATAWLVARLVLNPLAPLWPFAAAGLVLLALGLALLALARPSRADLAYTLDRDYRLRAQLFTAQEEAQGPLLSGLRALQVAAAMRVADEIEPRVTVRQRPFHEFRLLLAALVLTGALALVANGRGVGGLGADAAESAGLPFDDQSALGLEDELSGVSDSLGERIEDHSQSPGADPGVEGASDPAAAQDQSGDANNDQHPQAQGDLDTLADALKDTGATRAAADKLREGDYQGAADALREAGRDVGRLSPQARRDLAADLRDAAGRIGDPTLRRQLEDAADALERGDGNAAQSALDSIARDIDPAARPTDGQGPGDDGARDGAARTRAADGNQAGRGVQPNPSGTNTGGSGGTGASPALPGGQRSGPTYGPSTAPLGADEKPVKLPKGNQRGATVRGSGGGNRVGVAADSSSAGTGDGKLQQGEIGEVGPEINRVPVDQRGAVERYFTPSTGADRREPAP